MNKAFSNTARLAAATGFAIAALGATTTAHAETRAPAGEVGVQTSCPSSGSIDRAYVCTSLSSGVLFHRKYTNDVASTWYSKDSGGRISARLGYDGAGSKWTGYYTILSGQKKTGSWSGVAYCNSTIGKMQVKGQQTFQTPLANCDR
ncbi:hypothetical protein KBZ10_24855 [Streptomyces sp. F63]|uniref:hypothetical protein n=1 Tax=Streptomyces sp. F63 TaxID=2824887 RepID=UPI001B36C6BB|nr:hypothetical protein [Streptomyces sp. F63]MBQ0987689.1 hypothetical protein [Streptomyces sp. F63]